MDSSEKINQEFISLGHSHDETDHDVYFTKVPAEVGRLSVQIQREDKLGS